MWLKIKLGAIALIAAMWYYIKYLTSKNARLEHNEKTREKIDEIKVKQDEITEEILKHEDERIENRVKANSNKSRRDRANRL